MFVNRKLCAIAGVSTAFTLWSSTALAQTVPIVRQMPPAVNTRPLELEPPVVRVPVKPGAVTLKPGTASAIMRTLQVKRRLALPELLRNPVITLGQTKLNLSPVLNNPQALPNVAARLRQMPQLATVLTETSEIDEVEQGLIIRNFMTYELKTGACRGANTQLLASAGISCLSRTAGRNSPAAYSDPASPRFIADPQARARAIAAASTIASQSQTEVVGHIAEFRRMLSNPAQRLELEAKLGSSEVQRIAGLADDDLKSELVNSGETRIEQVMFVPRNDKVESDTAALVANLKSPSQMLVSAMEATGTQGQPAPPAAIVSDKDLPRFVVLTGFTLGREYEWSKRIEKTVSWCFIGCRRTYYGELYAGFSYGFGLRFPIEVKGGYHFDTNSGRARASVTPTFVPINGSDADYLATGLASDQLFSGKELVAEVTAYAGARYKLPFVGSDGIQADVGKDFTQGLPAPFSNGQFTPPAPGQVSPAAVKIFDDFDLIAGRANWGVVGGQVFPAIKVNLLSEDLSLTLKDNISGTSTQVRTSGQRVPLAVNPSDNTSDFSLGQPVYNLSFLVTPGIVGRLFVDIDVWSDSWDWPVWFPELAVQLPPGGVNFSCHKATVCSQRYRYGPNVSNVAQGERRRSDNPRNWPTEWAQEFSRKWPPQCLDETCRTAMQTLQARTVQRMNQAMSQALSQPFPDFLGYVRSYDRLVDDADAMAKTEVNAAGERLRSMARAVLPLQKK